MSIHSRPGIQDAFLFFSRVVLYLGQKKTVNYAQP